MSFTNTLKTKRITFRKLGLIITGLLLSFSLAACNGQSLFTTPTVTFTITPTITTTPTLTPMPIFTPSALADTDLPQGWRLDEYATGSSFNIYKDTGYYQMISEKYSFDFDSRYLAGFNYSLDPVLINGQLIQVANNVPDEGDREIIVKSDDNVVYYKVCHREEETFWWNLITFWTYEDHWVVEQLCEGKKDIIIDGQSLNDTKGYTDSFSGYLLSGKLFFFFYRGDQTGFNYDGKEYLLKYEIILYNYCCGISWANPEFYGDKVHFCATRGGDGSSDDIYTHRYDVVMGILDTP
jgi:hypothetical protein